MPELFRLVQGDGAVNLFVALMALSGLAMMWTVAIAGYVDTGVEILLILNALMTVMLIAFIGALWVTD